MRILYVSPFFPPVIGGVESVLETTCKGLADQGHEIKVLTSPVKGFPMNESVGHYLVQRSTLLQVPSNEIIPGEQFDFHRISNLIADVASDFEPDVVHFHNYQMRQYGMFLWAFLQGLGHKYPVLDTIHNDADDIFTQYLLSYAPLDQIVSVTGRAATQLLSAGVPPERVSVVSNMVDAQKFRTANGFHLRNKLGVRDDDCLILFPSRIIGREGNLMLNANGGKGLTTLIQSLPEILEVDPNAKLLLIGNDSIFPEEILEAKTKLFRMVERIAGKNCLVFLDEDVPNSLLPEVFAAADMVVSLSDRETFGIVFLEGMAAGKPVIGVNSNYGGVAEVVPDGRAGYLIPPDDPHATAKAISKFLVDEVLRKHFGLNGIRWVNEKFDTKIVLPKLLSLYRVTTRDILRDRSTQTVSPDTLVES